MGIENNAHFKKKNNLMKEYKFEKDVWFIIQGENPHGNILMAGDSLTTINEVIFHETEDQWKSAKEQLSIPDHTVTPVTPDPVGIQIPTAPGSTASAPEPKKERVVRVDKKR